jgi:hypothetical protein
MKKLPKNFKGKIVECNDFNFAGDENVGIGYILSKQNEILKEFSGLYPRLWAIRDGNLFHHGVTAVSNNFTYWSTVKPHKVYLIDENFEFVNNVAYDCFGRWHGQYLPAWINDRLGFIDRTGRFVIEPFFVEIKEGHPDPYESDLFVILIKNDGMWGCIDENLREIVPFKYVELKNYGYDNWVNKEEIFVVQNTDGEYGVYYITYTHSSKEWLGAFTGCIFSEVKADSFYENEFKASRNGKEAYYYCSEEVGICEEDSSSGKLIPLFPVVEWFSESNTYMMRR